MNLKLMKLIARLSENDRYANCGRRVNASSAFLLAMAILTILLCALSKNAVFTVTVLAILSVRVALLPAGQIPGVVKPLLAPVVMSLVVMLPAVFMGSPGTMLTVTMKVVESVMILEILENDIGWKGITGGLGTLGLPEMFILILDTTMRFLDILGKYSNEIVEAVMLRRVGRKDWKNAGTGGILGITFIKSKDMADDMEAAMACRCFNGRYRSISTESSPVLNTIAVVATLALIGFFCYTEVNK